MNDMEFVTHIAKMGDQKRVIIIPKDYWPLIDKEKLTKEVRVRIEKI